MFVVFEGIDGSGKTTLSNRVAERLRARGLSVKHVRAEGKFASPVTEGIRSLARDSRHVDLTPRAEFLLYVARDVQLVDEVIRPALDSHDVVIADRYLYTAEVLARFGRGLSPEYVAPVVGAAIGGLLPELVLLIDVDPVLARARRKASKLMAADTRAPSRKGLAGSSLQQRVRRGYRTLAASDPERWAVFSNAGSLDESVERLIRLIEGTRQLGARAALAVHAEQSGGADAAEPYAASGPEEALAKFMGWLARRTECEPQVAAYFLSGLSGGPVDALRRTLAERVPEVVLSGLVGLTDELSWELRERLCERCPTSVAKSLRGAAGLDERAHPLRDALWLATREAVLESLGKHQEEAAWARREEALGDAADAVMRSLAGVDAERGWRMRESWLARHEGRLAEDYGLACVAAKSVQGLDDERAWSVREAIRAAAPVAYLGSLSALTSERSFAARRRYLTSAPKAVMESLRRLDVPEAWELRRRVAGQTKEALDGMSGNDGAEAWELRDAHADLWPSTVAKSLGPLADGERGRALLVRLLARHPDNLSLLKHAAAVALGCHRVGAPSMSVPDLRARGLSHAPSSEG